MEEAKKEEGEKGEEKKSVTGEGARRGDCRGGMECTRPGR